MIQNKVLFIGRVWPEPASSAAGWRMLQLIDFFANQNYQLFFGSAAAKTEFSFDLEKKGIEEISIELNHPSFNDFVKKLQPDIVVYDRYISEEQFGWRLRQECPEAIEILDTEDLHFLRFARETGFKKNQEMNLYNEIAFREIASILRCDLSLIISEFEMKLLTSKFAISPALLCYLPLFKNEIENSQTQTKTFEERKDFVFIGNFLHEPNRQAVLELKNKIWPKIRAEIPEAVINIYGAYPTQQIFDLHQPKDGFLVHGRAENSTQVIADAKILFAPLPFGAGVKGKFIEAMQTGTPIVTNTTGAESMFENEVPGVVEDDVEALVIETKTLYSDREKWLKAQQTGFEILNKKLNPKGFLNDLTHQIETIGNDIQIHRNKNFIGQILKRDFHNSLKYMSLWIEEKNKTKQ